MDVFFHGGVRSAPSSFFGSGAFEFERMNTGFSGFEGLFIVSDTGSVIAASDIRCLGERAVNLH